MNGHAYGPDRLAAKPDQHKGERVAVEAVDRPERDVEVDRHHFGGKEPELALASCGSPPLALASCGSPPAHCAADRAGRKSVVQRKLHSRTPGRP